MKKTLSLVLILCLGLFGLVGCGGNDAAQQDAQEPEVVTITVGASVTPHAEILNAAKDAMAAKGFNLEVVEYNDYVIPNTATEGGDIDANYFQHYLYLDDFNLQNETHLVAVAPIHYEPFGIYAGKTTALADLAEGAVVAVPNDATNEARALQLLQEQGIITLKEGVGLQATKLDIVENPLNVEIMEIEAAQLPRSLQDVDVAVINGNYAIEGGLKVSEALAIEDSSSDMVTSYYANVLVVREGNEENPAVLALVEALQSDEVKTYIQSTYDGAVVPMF